MSQKDLDPKGQDLDQELSQVFRAELAAALDALAGQLDRLTPDAAADPAVCRDAMRIAHNVKGAARVVGFVAVGELAHALEDVLGALVDEPDRAQAPGVVDHLGRVVSRLESFSEGTGDLDDASEFAAELRGLVPGLETAAAEDPTAALRPENAELDSAEESETEAPRVEETMRVHVHRLDRLMASTGELLIAQESLVPRAERLGTLHDELTALGRRAEGDVGARLRRLAGHLGDLRREDRESLRRMSYLAGDTRDAMRRVRMIPLAALLPAWRRVVREASRDTGRPARLLTEIGDVEIDRTILDALRDPLMHLLRNAVGHGLRAGAESSPGNNANRTGTVRVRAGLAGGSVRIEIADNGSGVDLDVLRARAVDLGIVDADEVEALGPDEALDLIFRPGFSTVRRADSVSGRGMGLDIVRSRIHAFGGTVDVVARGEMGGAEFHLVVPASLVSLRGLDLRCNETTVVLPIDSVERTARIRSEELRQTGEGAAVSLGDDEPIHLRDLSQLLGYGVGSGRAANRRGWLPVVVVRSGRRRLGLVVDEILGEGDHVTGSLPWCFGAVPGVAGATILGGGRVAPVIDVAGLFGRRETDESLGDELESEEPQRRKILVVDDSITSRTLERNILQAAGYEVETGVDGEDGWQKLLDGEFDLLVTDIEMPRLDGLGLTRRVRGDDSLRGLPVIVVSSLGSEDDLETGARAGADEYLVKSRFDQRALLDAVSRHVN